MGASNQPDSPSLEETQMSCARNRWKVTLPLAALCLTAALVAPARARAADPSAPALTIRKVDASATAVRSYWTEERMRNARPMDLPLLGPRSGAGLQTRGSKPSGAVLVAVSGLPGDEPREVRIPASELKGRRSSRGRALAPRAGTHPFAFTGYSAFPESIYTVFPHSAIGKLFHTVPGFGDFVCTAAVINSENRSLVWSAGHCLGTFGIFHQNLLFVPARRQGEAPFGSWTAEAVVIPPQWLFGFIAEYDYGAFVAARGGNDDQCIADAVGFLGFLANAPREQHWHVFGYPALPPFDGETQEICATVYGGDDLPTGGPGDPPTRGVGCDHTAGTSGGPWLVDFSGEAGMTNLVNGSSSYRYTSPPPELEKIYGPYYGHVTMAIREAAQHHPVPGCP